MADVSLDDYIQKKNFTVQIRNVGNESRAGKSFVKGKVKFQKQATRSPRTNRVTFRSPKNVMMQKQRNGRLSLQTKKNNIISLQTRKNKGLQDKSNIKPISVSFPNKNLSGFDKTVFDARDKIAAAKRPNDARDKLAAKAKLSDARMKIQQNKNKQNNKSGQVIVTGLGKTFKTINTEVKTNPDFTRTINSGVKTNTGFTRTIRNQGNSSGGVQMSGNSMTITRNVNNASSQINTSNHNNGSTNFKITRTLGGQGSRQGVQMSGNAMTITRNIDNTQSQNVQITSGRGPVFKVQNDEYETVADPLVEEYYDEPVGYHYGQPKTHVTEKTLTVKYPQTLRPQPIPVITSKPPIKPAPIAVKRKAPTQGPLKFASSGPLKLASGPLKFAKTTMVADMVDVIKKPKLIKQEIRMAINEDQVPDLAQTLVSPLQGYKISITNLHPVVSQDDIVELFGAVGAMKRARLVKEGIGEVMYVQKEDAAKAIQKYHNRELDGIPMQVKLAVPKQTPVAKPVVTTAPSEDTPPSAKAEPLKLFKGTNKKVPESDIETGTLHRALFKTGVTQPSKLVTFTVKI
ncbi:POLDIP3 [Mytilus coruscus]|uniref:POLDIP3 n=1 Tax=Mytilus coruscus TaxID=42192 RepID=A0A6J8DKX3_MYTCO|nr:POLDIP3 [Mytilus coruscus]